MLAIIDYGMANLRSVQKAFQRLGHDAAIVSAPEQIRQSDRIVVPGVGAFRDAIAVMNKTGLGQAIKDHIRSGKPLLGICLGMQILMDAGFEDGEHAGLGVIPGQCVRFTVDSPPLNLKVPHMGWNSLHFPADSACPLFKGLPASPFVYFVHSFHVQPKDSAVIAASCDYGPPFAAAIQKENIMATQFHPEKSQEIGSLILKNFAEFK